MAASINKNQHPLDSELDALLEAYTLVVIAREVGNSDTGTKNKKRQALYKASIIFICASLETFLEVAIENSLKFIIDNIEKSDSLPENLKLRISKRLNESKDEREIWKISDQKWKDELLINFRLLKEKFNTPRPHNIDEFVYQTTGLKNISDYWYWQKHSASSSKKNLNNFMSIRGDITHRVFIDEKIYVNRIDKYMNFIYRISVITSNELREHVYSIVNKYPWDHKNEEPIFH